MVGAKAITDIAFPLQMAAGMQTDGEVCFFDIS